MGMSKERVNFRNEEVEANLARLKEAKGIHHDLFHGVIDPTEARAKIAAAELLYNATMVDISQRRRAFITDEEDLD